MRRCYLVCYDIHDPKRLQRVFRVMKGYGEHWQFSVFFCILKDIDRVRLQSDLESEMNLKEDQIIIIDLGGNEGDARQAAVVIGPSLEIHDERIIVI
ncbi:MAG: CRISPR-associated endonuclease Cas2 [Dissulfurispiraceae bacterium]